MYNKKDPINDAVMSVVNKSNEQRSDELKHIKDQIDQGASKVQAVYDLEKIGATSTERKNILEAQNARDSERKDYGPRAVRKKEANKLRRSDDKKEIRAAQRRRFLHPKPVTERKLTHTEKKKREEIAQDMDDAGFKDRYGDRWKEVKMAVATKQAKEEFDEGESIDLDEATKYEVVDNEFNKKNYPKLIGKIFTGKKVPAYVNVKKIKEDVELDEKITRDQTYFKSYSDAVTYALKYTKSRGYEVDEDDFAAKVTHGPRKPSEGKTVSKRIDVTKNGKPQKKQLSFQVYNTGGKNPYELNVYVEGVEKEIKGKDKEEKEGDEDSTVDDDGGGKTKKEKIEINPKLQEAEEKMTLTDRAFGGKKRFLKRMKARELRKSRKGIARNSVGFKPKPLFPEEIELDEALSGDVKKWFAKKGLKGIKVRTVSGKNPFMQVTRGSNDKIPNDIIKKALKLQYGSVPHMSDPDNIEYGNFGSRMFSLSLDNMAKLVKEEVDLDEDMSVTFTDVDGVLSQRDLDHVQKELRRLGVRDAVVNQNEKDSTRLDVKTKKSNAVVKKAFDKSKMTVLYNHVQVGGGDVLDEGLKGKSKSALKALLAQAERADFNAERSDNRYYTSGRKAISSKYIKDIKALMKENLDEGAGQDFINTVNKKIKKLESGRFVLVQTNGRKIVAAGTHKEMQKAKKSSNKELRIVKSEKQKIGQRLKENQDYLPEMTVTDSQIVKSTKGAGSPGGTRFAVIERKGSDVFKSNHPFLAVEIDRNNKIVRNVGSASTISSAFKLGKKHGIREINEARDYAKERKEYHGTPKQMKNNAARKRARYIMTKMGKVKLGDGMDVAHKDNNPQNNDPKNLVIQTPAVNRAEPRMRDNGGVPVGEDVNVDIDMMGTLGQRKKHNISARTEKEALYKARRKTGLEKTDVYTQTVSEPDPDNAQLATTEEKKMKSFVQFNEVSAADRRAQRDARRDSRHERGGKDAADKDDTFLGPEHDGGENIIMQLRKASSVNKPVKFKDGKSSKVDKHTARALQDKFAKLRTASEKEKFMKVASSSFKAMTKLVEEVELEEARQLKNPKKEVMIVKKGKVIVIDKKDAKEYLNKGWQLAEEVELDELTPAGKGFAAAKADDKERDELLSRKKKGKLTTGGIRRLKQLRGEEVDLDETMDNETETSEDFVNSLKKVFDHIDEEKSYVNLGNTVRGVMKQS